MYVTGKERVLYVRRDGTGRGGANDYLSFTPDFSYSNFPCTVYPPPTEAFERPDRTRGGERSFSDNVIL